MMEDDDCKLLRGFGYGLTDIGECRVAFATENLCKCHVELSSCKTKGEKSFLRRGRDSENARLFETFGINCK